MAELGLDFDNTPDEIPTLPEGKYDFEITEEPEIKETKSGNGHNLVIKLKINNEETGETRTITHYIFLDNEFGRVNAKKLYKACGIETSNPTTTDLIGATGTALIGTRTWEDDAGEQHQSNTVKGFIS